MKFFIVRIALLVFGYFKSGKVKKDWRKVKRSIKKSSKTFVVLLIMGIMIQTLLLYVNGESLTIKTVMTLDQILTAVKWGLLLTVLIMMYTLLKSTIRKYKRKFSRRNMKKVAKKSILSYFISFLTSGNVKK